MDEDASEHQLIRKVDKIIKAKWYIILICAIVLGFFLWLLYTSASEIYVSIREYLKNKKQEKQDIADATVGNPLLSSGQDTSNDDEVYKVEVKDEPDYSIDNEKIKANIKKQLSAYDKYNKLLQDNKKTEDIVDEKIIAKEYDNYLPQPKKTS
jgi:predicted PurR-regulated permease PerM